MVFDAMCDVHPHKWEQQKEMDSRTCPDYTCLSDIHHISHLPAVAQVVPFYRSTTISFKSTYA